MEAMILIEYTLECNMGCRYCYNKRLRASWAGHQGDLERILKAMEQLAKVQPRSTICLHGGEPSIWPREVVEVLLDRASELTDRLAIQTNALELMRWHFEVFRRYNVHVGVSVDGPWPLNRFRTDARGTERVLRNLERLLDAGVATSLIVVLHRANAASDALETLGHFIETCVKRGIQGRLNPCVSDDPEVALQPSELRDAYLKLAEIFPSEGPYWSPFSDIKAALEGARDVVCFLRPCYPFYTPSALVVMPDGRISTCHRNQGEVFGCTFQPTNVRLEILEQTDCRGCPYFGHACFGGCPAAASQSDWRRKDRNCLVWRSLLDLFSNRCAL